MTHNYTKIRFFVHSFPWPHETAENLWAEPVGQRGSGAFRLMNSPYYSREASYLDIVRATEAPDGLGLDYADTIQASGHSTVWLFTPLNSPEFKPHWQPLHSHGCTYEGFIMDTPDGKRTLYSVDIPPEADFEEVLSILNEGQNRGVWLFHIGHVGRDPAPDPTASGSA